MDINMLKYFKRPSNGKFELYKVFGKRLFDIVFALFSLIFLSFIFFGVSFLIKLFDPGPVIFQQKRVGLNSRVFDFYKFRSMPINTKDITSDQIGRLNLSWVGKLIRRTNIDELPQLYNILKGDMSFVGPRPALLIQKDLIEYRRQNGALFFRPGLTGLAQIMSFNGMNVRDKSKFDGDYIISISLKFDLQIIFKTLIYLFKPPPIY